MRSERRRVESFTASQTATNISNRIDSATAAMRPRPTGIRNLDGFLNGGFRPGQLVVVGARTSHGKTAFGVGNVALECAARGFKTAIISLEMSDDEIGSRISSSMTGIPVETMLSHHIEAETMPRVVNALAGFAALPIVGNYPRDMRTSNIIRLVRSAVRRDGAQVVILDYLQRVQSDNMRMDRREAVAYLSGQLKSLAMELGVPVVVLAQLNRVADGIRPRSAHLAECSAIENDADTILLIYRPDNEEGEPQDVGWIIIDKARNGRKGRARVEFLGSRCCFVPTDDEPVENERRGRR